MPDARTTKGARHPPPPVREGAFCKKVQRSVSDNARVCAAALGGLASGRRINKEPIYSEEPLPSATHALAGCVAGLKSAYMLFTSSASAVALSVFSASLMRRGLPGCVAAFRAEGQRVGGVEVC